jgi:general secretion pathway protein E
LYEGVVADVDLSNATPEGYANEFDDDDLTALKMLAEDAPVVRFVQAQLSKAIQVGASDLHFEVFRDVFRVRIRIDGLLVEQERAPKGLYLPTISHLKIRAHMNIAERRLPQDGRAKFEVDGRHIDLRVSTVPTVYGESMVIRVLDQGPGTLDLEGLGLDERGAELFKHAIAQPHGMILVTGPTGSGKTTTLYAVLKRLNLAQNKIITVEDPVEYQIEGVNQIHVKTSIGLTFPSALRSIVRQDPDVILIGEIRDTETAEIAIQSALTGHLVLSTLHTNDSFGAVHRLMDMGVEGYLIASSVVLIVAQRLVRLICESCKEEIAPASADLALIDQLSGGRHAPVHLWHGKGCAACGHSGFRGRAGVYEFLPVTNAVKEGILARESAEGIRRIAVAEGVQPMLINGLQMVIDGKTTLEELLRVTRLDAA